MTVYLRAEICLCVVWVAFSLGQVARERGASNPASATDPVAASVVELLAVGPGTKGQNQECSATGFLVNEEGCILTNAHVVEAAKNCLSKSPGAKIMATLARLGASEASPSIASAVSCDLVGLDDVHDLAVLRTERPMAPVGSGAEPFARLEGSDAPAGTRVKVTGHPASAWTADTQAGHIVGHKKLQLLESIAEQSEVLMLDIPLRQGSSGSPVYLEAGGVVGIVERRDSSNASQTDAIPTRYAIDLLNRLGTKWHAAPR